MPSAVERKELQRFPVVREVYVVWYCYSVKLGCPSCVLMKWSGCGWGLIGDGANFHCS